MTAQGLDKGQIQKLFQYAMSLSQDRDEAYDLVQAAIETYLIKIRRGETIRQTEAYLRTLIRNRFIDHYRKRRQQPEQQYEELSDYDISPINLEELRMQQQELELIWAELDPLDRDIFYHWAILGYSTDEACHLLNVPRGSFLSRIHRIRKRLNRENSAPAKTGHYHV